MTPKTLKIWRRIAILAAIVVGIRFALPCPIAGYWRGPTLTENHGCYDHAFFEFSDGRVWFHHGEDIRRDYGTYRKVGWNRYEWVIPPPPKKTATSVQKTDSAIIVPGWILSRWYDEKGLFAWGYRDYQPFDARRIALLTATNSPTKRSSELPSAVAAGSRSP